LETQTVCGIIANGVRIPSFDKERGFMKNIAMIGVGYVGMVSGASFADLGNKVTCVDINEKRIANLNQGIMPIFEPGLEEVVRRNVKADRLHYTTSYEEALVDADFAFIAVGTPSDVDGQADLRYVRMAAESIADVMDHYIVIINKSTVPVGTGDWVADIIRSRRPDVPDFDVVSCPEFLREGSAISDFMNPDRVILGSTNRDAAEKVAQLHLPLRTTLMITDLRTAEMVKYASNAFLAAKVSFINEIANICEALGADVKEVAYGMGLDKRIGPAFLDAGLGWGGSCFPKDVKALASMAEIEGRHPHLLHAVMDINRDQRYAPLRKAEEVLGRDLRGKTIGVLGLSFKPNTDDMRDAPSVDIIRNLQRKGAAVRAYDPVAMENAAEILNDVEMMDNAYEVAADADALILVTEWNEFKNLDLKRVLRLMRYPLLIDGRNIYDPTTVQALGFDYTGIGRGYGGRGNKLTGDRAEIL
jgi:UDPglucose 6-dehydrogenase